MKLFNRNRGTYDHFYENQYAPKLLMEYHTSSNDCSTRETRIEIDPIANAMTIRVANLLTKNPPIFLDKSDKEIEEFKKDWIKNGYDDIFREVIRKSRTHGFCVTEKLSKPFAGKNFLVHGLPDMITVNYDDRWNILSYTILPKMEEGEKKNSYSYPGQRDLLAKNALHYEIGVRKNNQQGLSVLVPIWAQIVRANEILESMAAYDSRIGNGWLVVIVDPKLYQNDQAKLEEAVTSMNNKRYLMLKATKDSPTSLQFLSASGGACDFPRDLETILGYIAASSGFPIRWFIGDPKGALSSSKEDKIAVYSTLKSIFSEYKDFIRKFVEKFYEQGESISERIKDIKWNDEGVLEQIENQLNQNNQQANEMNKGVKYVQNEKQKEVVE